jgi:F-type H+-transporting ATPase subunit O
MHMVDTRFSNIACEETSRESSACRDTCARASRPFRVPGAGRRRYQDARGWSCRLRRRAPATAGRPVPDFRVRHSALTLPLAVLPVLKAMLSVAARTASSSAAASVAGRRAASTLALKYSKAAFNAALSKSPQTLSKVQAELAAVGTALKDVPDVGAFVSNPTLSAQDRKAGLDALYATAGGPKKEAVSDVTKNLFGLLADNGRLQETPGIIEGFNDLVAAHKGELTVVVTSATPLPRDVQTKLEASLKQSQAAQQAKSLKIQNKVRAFSVVACSTEVQRSAGQPGYPRRPHRRLWREVHRP